MIHPGWDDSCCPREGTRNGQEDNDGDGWVCLLGGSSTTVACLFLMRGVKSLVVAFITFPAQDELNYMILWFLPILPCFDVVSQSFAVVRKAKLNHRFVEWRESASRS